MFPDADFEGHVYPNFGLIMGSKQALMDLFMKLLILMDDFSDDQTVTFITAVICFSNVSKQNLLAEIHRIALHLFSLPIAHVRP